MAGGRRAVSRLGDRGPLRRRPAAVGARWRALRRRCGAVRAHEAADAERQPLGARLPRRDGRLHDGRCSGRPARAARLRRRDDAARDRADPGGGRARPSSATACGCSNASRTRPCAIAPCRSRWTARRSCRSASSTRCAIGSRRATRSSASRWSSRPGFAFSTASTKPAGRMRSRTRYATRSPRCWPTPIARVHRACGKSEAERRSDRLHLRVRPGLRHARQRSALHRRRGASIDAAAGRRRAKRARRVRLIRPALPVRRHHPLRARPRDRSPTRSPSPCPRRPSWRRRTPSSSCPCRTARCRGRRSRRPSSAC